MRRTEIKLKKTAIRQTIGKRTKSAMSTTRVAEYYDETMRSITDQAENTQP